MRPKTYSSTDLGKRTSCTCRHAGLACRALQVFYVPGNWVHAVRNLQPTIGLSSIPKNAFRSLRRALLITGQPRVTLLLRQGRLRAACGTTTRGKGPEIRPKTTIAGLSRNFVGVARLNKTASWSLGHPLLTAIASCLLALSRRSEELRGPEAHDMRKGGSEFVLFCFRRAACAPCSLAATTPSSTKRARS